LEEFKHSSFFPMYVGGPVDQEHLYFLHLRPDLIEEGTAVSDGIYLGGNLQQAVKAINEGNIGQDHMKIFVGYCGWDKGELETEIGEGSWVIIDGSREMVFQPYNK
jgi:putative transcriptional regulator